MESLKVGRVYLLAGGHIMRYQGLYAGRDGKPKGPCLAFRGVTGTHDPECPVGYSASAEQVRREITAEDIGWLQERRAQAAARGLIAEEVEVIDQILKELPQMEHVRALGIDL